MNKKFIDFNNLLLICQVFIFKKKGVGLNLGGLPLMPALTLEQIKSIQTRLEAAWAALFYPAPDDCAKTIVHDYLHESQIPKALEFLKNLSLGRKEIQDLLATQHALDQRNNDLSRKISRLDGIDRDGTLATMKTELETVTKRIDLLIDQGREQDRSMILETAVDRL